MSTREFSPQAFTKSGLFFDQHFMAGNFKRNLDGSLRQKWEPITRTGVSISLRKGETPLQLLLE